MGIEITARHIEVAAAVKEHMREKAEDIIREFPNVENVHVIIDGHGFRKVAEVVVQGKPHLHIEATDTADEVLPAIDASVDKAVAQLRKAAKKIQDHRK